MRWAAPEQQAAYMDAQTAAFAKQYDSQQAAEKAQQAPPAAPSPNSVLGWMKPVAHVTTDVIDDAIHNAEAHAHDGGFGEAGARVASDVGVGVTNAVVNTADAVGGAVKDTYNSLVPKIPRWRIGISNSGSMTCPA